jgi:hypothetical protein
MNKKDQVLYLGRWVEKATFRTFVYNDKEQKLANSYHEFEELIASGLWFTEKPTDVLLVKEKKGKPKHESNS